MQPTKPAARRQSRASAARAALDIASSSITCLSPLPLFPSLFPSLFLVRSVCVVFHFPTAYGCRVLTARTAELAGPVGPPVSSSRFAPHFFKCAFFLPLGVSFLFLFSLRFRSLERARGDDLSPPTITFSLACTQSCAASKRSPHRPSSGPWKAGSRGTL